MNQAFCDTSRPSIYGMGFYALDIVRSARSRMSIRSYAGGTCANVLAIMAYLGWEAHAIANLNGDAASKRVREDLSLAGVNLGLSRIAPTRSTPIVVQMINGRLGEARHPRFDRTCVRCGSHLPDFVPIPPQAVAQIATAMAQPSVFFFDRAMESSVELARIAAARGALVYFEPSEVDNPVMFEDALSVAHVVKYAGERLETLDSWRARRSVLLEIRTLGRDGLVFHSPWLGTTWHRIDSIPAPTIVDACGAGDWCTAGIIAMLGSAGKAGLASCSGPDVLRALRFGQALAAWNCGFEGARGGMYQVRRSTFLRQVAAILAAQRMTLRVTPRAKTAARLRVLQFGTVACPACPSGAGAAALAI